MSSAAWTTDQRVSRNHPCLVCRSTDWCGFSSDGRFVFCKRSETWRGTPAIRETDAGWMFALDGRKRASGLLLARTAPIARPAGLSRPLLDHVYRRLAELCGLDEHARRDLVNERCFPQALEGDAVYFSLPRSGKHNEAISDALVNEFGVGVIERVPGFSVACKSCDGPDAPGAHRCQECGALGKTPPRFRSVRGGRHDYGLIACDENGLAFWGMSRRLPYGESTTGTKYMLLSSSRAVEASLTGLPKYHLAGRHFPKDEVWVTEGVTKAEIAANFLRKPVVGLAGAAADAATLSEILRLLDDWQPARVVLGFDADKHLLDTNGKPAKPNVLAGEKRLIEAMAARYEVSSAEWHLSSGKGIDNLLVSGGTYMLVDRYEQPVPRPRVPRPCAEPGEVDGGDTLEDARAMTAERIGRRFLRGYQNTIVLIAPPPGTAKTGSGLREQETSKRRVAWGTATHRQADELVARAGDEPCRCGVRRGDCSSHRVELHHDYGRNADNCERIDVVKAARDAGYGARVGAWICGTATRPICPFFAGCLFQLQFDRPGSHVASSEIVTQRPTSTDQMSVVIMDDLDSSRLISERHISPALVERAEGSPGGASVRPLLAVLRRAVDSAARPVYHRSAYAALDMAARSIGTSLERVLADTPNVRALAPDPTSEAYEQALPGQLVDLVELLHEEFALYRAGTEFTSGLRVRAGGVDATRLLRPTVKSDGSTSLTGKAVAVLCSTPDPVLRQWMGQLNLEILKEYRPKVSLPHGVRVIQDTSGFYGKGSTQAKDPDRLIAKARAYIEEFRPLRPAVVTHKHLQAIVAEALGIPTSRVLYFGNMRGSNAVRDADLLLIVGTPGMASEAAYWQACAAFRGEAAPPSQRMAMRYRPYGGWRDARGLGREIQVLAFVDPRVDEIYEAARRDELIQAVYRCRPFDSDASRSSLRVVLLSAMPVAGLRVDELRLSGNADRSEEANRRLVAALDELRDSDVAPTARALAAAAGTSKDRALTQLKQVSAVCPPTYIETLIQVGGQGAETSSLPETDMQLAWNGGCSCVRCPANRGDRCNCGRYWFSAGRRPHCGVHFPSAISSVPADDAEAGAAPVTEAIRLE